MERKLISTILKEEIQGLMIKNAHSQILSNIEQISSSVENIL